MTKRLLAGVCLAAFAAVLGAAEIHGTVSEGDKAVPEGVALKLACAGTTAEAKTDQFGSYSLKIGATGECELSIDFKKASGSLKVAVYDKPSRYDIVVKEEAGKLTLARK